MKSAILDKGESHFTYMGPIFQGIKNEQIKYNWLITNCECYPVNKKISDMFSKKYCWLSGEKLTKIICEEDSQFIWGVFSGFSKDINLDEVLEYDLPNADGYEGFWQNSVNIQHPLADIEIVAWDSSLTLFISKIDKLVDNFRQSFPLSEDLSARNLRENSEIAHIEKLLIKELVKRNIHINKEILHKKYLIWNHLYLDREKLVKDEEILNSIEKIFKQDSV